jgi:ribulose-phosphate 3-epimerase
MTVMPGFGGQKFLNNQIIKIKKLNDLRKELNLKFEIEIDGGINNVSSLICKKNGADVLVAGSYIYGSSEIDYKLKIDSLR